MSQATAAAAPLYAHTEALTAAAVASSTSGHGNSSSISSSTSSLGGLTASSLVTAAMGKQPMHYESVYSSSSNQSSAKPRSSVSVKIDDFFSVAQILRQINFHFFLFSFCRCLQVHQPQWYLVEDHPTIVDQVVPILIIPITPLVEALAEVIALALPLIVSPIASKSTSMVASKKDLRFPLISPPCHSPSLWQNLKA